MAVVIVQQPKTPRFKDWRKLLVVCGTRLKPLSFLRLDNINGRLFGYPSLRFLGVRKHREKLCFPYIIYALHSI